jgi:hypothetical protein
VAWSPGEFEIVNFEQVVGVTLKRMPVRPHPMLREFNCESTLALFSVSDVGGYKA